MGEACRTECRAECRMLYREKKRTEEVISEVRREQSGAMNNGGQNTSLADECVMYLKNKIENRLKISNWSEELEDYSDAVFSSENLEATRRGKVSPGRDLVAFSGHGVTCTATETVKGNRDASSGRQCASREIKLIGKNQFLPGSTAAVLRAMPSESILYSSRRTLGAMLQSGLTSLSTIAQQRSSTFTRFKCVPPAHRISYDTYEKGAAFRESQSSDWSSGMRRSRYCEENEIDTAPKPRAHNCRCREEKCGTRAKGYLRGQSYHEIRFEFCEEAEREKERKGQRERQRGGRDGGEEREREREGGREGGRERDTLYARIRQHLARTTTTIIRAT
ncbi:hypothetical protein ALC57_09694 [Trachymyrmex cornetzi]|uniref:Uncharacterized protein n=1 Tax=Trachymyrmex cornetzi TaxID=471704 RepID=A0A195DZJ5_9HYME|nr:hypothetical protein ALC57_09694 [Trachymyrmex cornetzi]